MTRYPVAARSVHIALRVVVACLVVCIFVFGLIGVFAVMYLIAVT